MNKHHVAFVQADADRYHLKCAYELYGRERIETARMLQSLFSAEEIVARHMNVAPLDNEGNPIWVFFQEQWQEEKAQARLHGEPVYDSCGHCLKRIR